MITILKTCQSVEGKACQVAEVLDEKLPALKDDTIKRLTKELKVTLIILYMLREITF